jgi:ribosomal-protein-alanine N-acetyltransferase
MRDALMPVAICDAKHEDLADIVRIERLCFSQPWSRGSFERELTLPFSRLAIARLESGTSGFLCRWLIAQECHILNIAVHPDLRRHGIGSRLLSWAVAEAQAKGATFITLEVRRSNLAARSLYRKFQFEERRLRRNYYGPGEDALVMERRVNTSR